MALLPQRRCGRPQTLGLVSRGYRLQLDHVQQTKRRRHERQSIYTFHGFRQAYFGYGSLVLGPNQSKILEQLLVLCRQNGLAEI
jgi:hypothetical protein